MKNLENKLGLHQRVEIIYVVDGYQASLVHESEITLAEAFGNTVQEAIRELDKQLRPKLENWEVCAETQDPYSPPECIGRTVKGDVYGHQEIEDGSRVRTSTIQEIGPGFVRTANTEYQLGKPHPRYLEWCRENGHNMPAVSNFIAQADGCRNSAKALEEYNG